MEQKHVELEAFLIRIEAALFLCDNEFIYK